MRPKQSTLLPIARVRARAKHTAHRASALLTLRSENHDNPKLNALTCKACSIAGKWLALYDQMEKEQDCVTGQDFDH